MPEISEKLSFALVHGGLTSVAVVYGGYALVAKAAINHGANPMVFAFYRVAGATALMYILRPFLADSNADEKKVSDTFLGVPKNAMGTFLMLGVIMAMNIVGALMAVANLSAITCAIFAPTIPVVTTILGAALGVETTSPHKIAGILCSVAGAMVVVVFGGPSGSGENKNVPLGMMYITMNVGCMALYFVLSKNVVKDHSPVTVMASSFLISSVVIFMVALASAGFNAQIWAMNYATVNYACAAYAVLLAATYNYLVLAWANKKTSPTTVTSYTTLQPLTAALVSSAFLGTNPTASQSIGGVVIVAGLLLNIRAQILEQETSDKESQPLQDSKLKQETA